MQKKIKKKILENNSPPPAPAPQSATSQSSTAPNTQTQQASAGTATSDTQTQAHAVNQQQDKRPTAKPVNHSQLLKNIDRILADMVATSKGRRPMTLLTGDTGIGKTSFVKLLGKIFGLPEMIIEVPQVVGEHLINIPFIVINKDGQVSSGTEKIEAGQKKYEIVYGKSYIVGSMNKMTKLTDSEWQDHYQNKLNNNDRQIIDAIEDRYPGMIKKIRSKFNRILFLDEFLRTAPTYVRNILRDLMVGRLGADTLPDGTYILYASNIEDIDGSLDKLSSHQRFNLVPFAPPSKDQWLSFTLSQLTKENIAIKKDVEIAFERALKDEHVSYNDAETNIRTSPRRWTEIFIYLNQVYPFADAYTAGLAYQSIKRQFAESSERASRISGAFSSVLEDMMKELCRKSNISEKDFITTVSISKPSDWQKILAQNISVMAETAGLKKYVPVILGLPGVGKSSLIAQEFEKPPYNFRVILVDSQKLTTEDVVGITIPEEVDKKTMNVSFSEPPLYIQIKNSIKEAEKNYKLHLKDEEAAGKIQSAEIAWDSYTKQKHKYVIFFDEINRISNVGTFNALRRVILEKEFNPDYKLPSTALVVGAMNPEDIATVPMTNHFRDAIEIVDSAPNWKSYLEFLKTSYSKYMLNEGSSEMAVNTAIQFIEQFPKTFSDSKSNKEFREFYFKTGTIESWISPRDLELMAARMISAFDLAVDRVVAISKKRRLQDNEEIEIIADQIQPEVEGTLKGILYAEELGLDQPEVYDKVHDDLLKIVSKNFTKTVESADLDGIMDGIVSGEITDLSENSDWFNYMNDYQSNTFADEFRGYLKNRFNKPGQDNAQEFNDAMVKIAQVVETGLERFEADILDRLGEAYRDLGREISKINKNDTSVAQFLVSNYKKYKAILDSDKAVQ
jgi:MoxR-like ATPase